MIQKISLLVCLLSCLFSSFSYALELSVDDEAKRIYSEIFSPFCPGRVLSDCPSQQASELKNSIRLKLIRGESRENIVHSLVDTYGDEVLASPPLSGFGWFAWGVPIFFFSLGILIWILVVSRDKAKDGSKEKEENA